MIFRDRVEAGRRLAERLVVRRGPEDLLVLALPRGGVPVGYEVARALGAPLDVFIVRKLGVPGHEELAMGAIASGGVRVLNEEVVRQLPNAAELIERATEREHAELSRREAEYRAGRSARDIRGRKIILVDDGLATGATMRAAVAAVKARGAASIVVAVPVGASDTCELLSHEVKEVVCLAAPPDFHSVGQYYEDFGQTTDAEVRELLSRETEKALQP
jgi:predicted phosphoribosyltransferase